MKINETALRSSIAKDSFIDFVKVFWDTIIPEEPIWNWHIDYLCGILQNMAERVFAREPKEHDLIINISPGSTKSTVCSVMFPVWCWVRDATIRSICGSYAYPLSLKLATQSRNILTSDKFDQFFPEIVLRETQKSLITNSATGERIATSTGGSITGMHGHFLIIDDPINPKEAVSETMLASANDWIDQTLMTRKVDKKVTPLILIMQRLHQDDPTGHLLEQRDKGMIRHVCLPAIKTPDVKPRRLRKYYKDGLMDPVRLDSGVLKAARVELGEYGYAGQYLQNPIPLGGGMFKTGRIQFGVPPSKMVASMRYWDKAGTQDGGAYTVGVLMAKDKEKRFWVVDVIRGRWDAAERERIIKQTAQMDGLGVVVGVEQEPGSGGKESAQNTVRNLAGFRVRKDLPRGDKVLRADPYAVQVNDGNVMMKKALWNRDYLEELKFFPHSKFKDQVDASSGAFALLTSIGLRIGGLRR